MADRREIRLKKLRQCNDQRPITGLTWSEREFLERSTTRGAKRILRNGWPDFLVEFDGATYAVEVKAGGDDLSDWQAKMFAALERAGVKVFVWNPARPEVLTPWRKYLTTMPPDVLANKARRTALKATHKRSQPTPPEVVAHVRRSMRRWCGVTD